ncbi:MAG: glutamine amidotransferase [Pseudorhodoplanes sp.]|nr:glutamine amidotransferase [Pseudorhodoplanes sp.]
MRKCLAIRHVAFEDAGLLSGLLAERGFSLRYLEAGVDRLDPSAILSADLLLVLGGPIGVYETDQYPFLRDELAAIRVRLDQRKATLGICLGAQLIAKALDADVAPGPQKEIGWAPVTLSEAGRKSALSKLADVPVLHWHGDNAALPAGAVTLASTTACPHQAFAIGQTILALQFHIEADPARIEQWLVGHTVELGKAGIDPRMIRDQAAMFGGRTAAAGRETLSAWLAQACPAQ